MTVSSSNGIHAKFPHECRLGLSSYANFWAIQGGNSGGMPRMSTSGLVDRAAELGLKAVQLCENLPLLEFSAETLHELKEAFQHRDIHLEVGVRGLDAEILYRHLGVAQALGARILRIVPWTGRLEREWPVLK